MTGFNADNIEKKTIKDPDNKNLTLNLYIFKSFSENLKKYNIPITTKKKEIDQKKIEYSLYDELEKPFNLSTSKYGRFTSLKFIHIKVNIR
tara:strand:+ start:203 stop:475 length:273 start_codon:yes stop_codon:yes gene_type:complete